jgi:hypothetical protein
MKYMLAVDKSRSALHALVWILKHAKADDHVYLAHVYHMEGKPGEERAIALCCNPLSLTSRSILM